MPIHRMSRQSAAGAAAVAAFLSAACTLYWTLGGKALLASLGPTFEKVARERSGATIALGVTTFALKTAAGFVALAFSGPQRDRIPRPARRTVRAMGFVLAAYGAVGVIGASLGLAGVGDSETADRAGLWGHALLWDPWFVVWGVLLSEAARGSHAATTPAFR